MGESNDLSEALQARVRQAFESGESICIEGSGSKRFYGRPCDGFPLPVADHTGITSYDPAELVITVRAGTQLEELTQALAENGQMLAAEPPRFGPGATIGGVVACGLSGPRRPYGGALRDAMLGVTIINGRGELLHFGGQVMKNVAGFDLSRLMTGAMGTLGVLLEVSLRVMPLPQQEQTMVFEFSDAASAILQTNRWAAQPLPLSAASWQEDGRLRIRISGGDAALAAARARMGGELDIDGGNLYWQELREQTLPFFAQEPEKSLWRLSLPPAAPSLAVTGRCLIDWGGAQRWLVSDLAASSIRAAVAAAGGHATLFRGGDHGGDVFQPLSEPLRALHWRLKHAFDPAGILNPGRLYPEV